MNQNPPPTIHVSARIELVIAIVVVAIIAALSKDPITWLALVAVVIAAMVTVAREAYQGEAPVDIWSYQADLMTASGQLQPGVPMLHEGTLLYAALQAEEFAEQIQAMLSIMRGDQAREPEEVRVFNDLTTLESWLSYTTVALRAELSKLEARGIELAYGMSMKQARDLMDGVTDVAVVTAGFGISAGLPVRAAYRVVGTSNDSKKNPHTGMIDKDPSGKWIKGVNYVKPDKQLDMLLFPHYQASGVA